MSNAVSTSLYIGGKERQTAEKMAIADPAKPAVVAEVPLKGAGHSAVQFRYAFVNDAEGMKVIDRAEDAEAALESASREALASGPRRPPPVTWR